MSLARQIAKATVSAATSISVSFPGNVVAGNLLVIVVGTTGTPPPSLTVGDTQVNSYTFWDNQWNALSGSETGGVKTYFATAGSSAADTINISWTGSQDADLIILEYPATSPTIDNSTTSFGTGNVSNISYTPAVANELLIGWSYVVPVDGSPWTTTGGDAFAEETHTNNASGHTLLVCDFDATNTASRTANMTDTNGVAGNKLAFGIIAFKGVSFGPPPLVANCNTPPNGYVNSPYFHAFTATGGTPAYTFAVSAGSLPTGLTLNPATGTVSGTPTAAGSFSFSIKVTDSAAATSTVNCSIHVTAASAAPFLNLVATQINRLQAMFDNTKSVGNLQMINMGGELLYFSKQQYPFLSANELATAYGSDTTGKIWNSISSIATGINSPGAGTSTGMGLDNINTKVYLSDSQQPIDAVAGLNHTLGIWTYDTSAHTWSGPSAGGPFMVETSSGASSVVALNSGKLLVVFNQLHDNTIANTALLSVIYDPITNTWGAPITLASYGAAVGNQTATPLALIQDPVTDNTVLFFIPGSTNSTPNLNLEAMVLSNTGALLNTPSSIFLFTTLVPVNGSMGVPCVTADSPSGGPSAAFPFLDQSGNVRVAWVDFTSFAQTIETAAFAADLEPPNAITSYTLQNQGGWTCFDFNGFCYLTFTVDNGKLNSASSQSFLYAKSRGHSTTWSGFQLLFTSASSREPLQPFKALWTTDGPAILLNLWDPTVSDQSGTFAGGMTSFILLPPSSNPAPPPAPFQIKTLRYEIPKKRWFPHSYADTIVTHYLDELFLKNVDNEQLLMLSSALGFIYRNGGDTDNGTAITSIVTTPSMDGGDDRSQKLYVDVMNDVDGTGTMNLFSQFTNQTINGPSVAFPLTGGRVQVLQNISSLAALNLYRNIAITYQWTGGPDGPRVYVCEPAGYLQPYISTFFVTQFINLAFPGYKHHRRLSAGYISNNTILFTIKTQDGRTYGPYSLPSTAGQFQIVTIMLDQNIKDKAFAYQIDGQGNNFALFPEAWTIETKEWQEPDYIDLAIFKT